jgi:hypothetical protein
MPINRYSRVGLFIILALFAIPARAEIRVASSVEWLVHSSDIIAVGKIVDVKSSKGPGAVIYDDCTLQVTELIKSPVARSEITFTFRRFEQDQSAVEWQRDDTEMLIFLSPSKDHGGEKHLDEALVPTSKQSPLSLVNLSAPGKYIFDINFRILRTRADILRVTRAALQLISNYLQANGELSIKRYYLEVPGNAEAYQSLYAGSSCYLQVPSFMSKEARPNFY